MTGRERVTAAITFTTPDRPPRDLWALPAVHMFHRDQFDAVCERFPMDIGRSEITPAATKNTLDHLGQVGTYVDEWGSVWHVGEPGIVGEVKGPRLDDWAKLADFQPPWHLLDERDRDHVNRNCAASDQFMLSDVTARPFERLQFLRGTENLFMDLAYDRAELRQLLDILHDFYLKDVAWWCNTDVDGVFFMDDWGTNSSLLIQPAMWREFFKPLYTEYVDMIHAAGKYAFFHSDGHTEAIYPDLVEIGVDAANTQLFCMDIEKLGREHGGKITFWGELDRQHVLPFGTPADVREAVRRVRRALERPAGGVIAQCEWGKTDPRANVEAAFAAWNEPPPED